MIEVTTNTAAFDASLRELQSRMGNLRGVMASIGAELESRTANRFETRSDPSGNKWADWSPIYKLTYPADGRRKILERSGDMLSGLSWQPRGDDAVRVGFNKDYSTYHEFGAPNNNMPRRGLLFADPESGQLGAGDEQAITEILEDWLSGVIS